MQKKYYVKDCPEDMTIVNWLLQNSDWSDQMAKIKPRISYPKILTFKISNFDADQLTKDYNEASETYGEYGWRHATDESSLYTGISLVYNPNHQDKLNIHASTLGTPKNKKEEFVFGSLETHQVLRNGYFDSYGFNVPTPASNHKSIGELMSRGKLTLIRSRISVLNGKVNASQTWHRDEPVFINTRINIPLTTNDNYLMEIKDYPPVNLPVGWAYSWDTHDLHKVYKVKTDNFRRIHLVLGFSPWWNYNPEEQYWLKNEFYGVKHPFDMLADGDVFEGLTLDIGKLN
jgi:hypothetical protein